MSNPFSSLPPGWQRTRLDHVATVSARIGWKALTAAEYQPDGFAFLSTPNIKGKAINFTDVNFISEFRYEESPELKLREGDVLLVKDGNTLGITNVVSMLPRPSTVNGSIALIRTRKMEPRFLRYVLASGATQGRIAAVKDGMGVPHLFQADIKKFHLPEPPMAEQRAIANYLDAETARLDVVISKKQRLLEISADRCRVATERLVLGLNEPGSPAHSPFLAHRPTAWGETNLRHLRCEVQTGPFGSQLHAEEYVDGGWPVVNPANLTGGTITPIPKMAVSEEKRAELARHILRVGDIVFGRRGEMGRAGLVTERESGWLCGTGSLRLRVRDARLNPGYLKLSLQSGALRSYLDLTSVGSTMDNLNSEILLGLPLLLPPLDQQRQIVAEVGRIEATRAALADRLGRQVRLLAEHRQALITAAVTGEHAVPAVTA